MKIQQAVILATILLLASSVQTFAIEGLKISLQSSNLVYFCPVLTWPSVEGETYIIQYRPTLNTNDSWVTLTNSLPAATGTNSTSYYLDCSMQLPAIPVGLGGDDTNSPPGPSGSASSSSLLVDSEPQEVMAKPADGSSPPVELAIFPFGFDLSYLMIYDPAIGYWVKGSDYNRQDTSSQNSSSALAAPTGPGPSGPTPSGGGGTPDSTGFFQVVRDGVYIVGLTNLTNSVLSDTVTVAFEAGNADPNGPDIKGILECAVIGIDAVGMARDAVLAPPAGSPWQFSLDTAFLENGEHTVWVEVTWKNPDSSDNNNQYLTRYSDNFTITVSNQVYYPDWVGPIGEANIASYYLKTVYTNAPWRIDIKDVNGATAQTLTGFATNGVIEAHWNLVDTNGVQRTNAAVDPVFSSLVTVNPGQSNAAPRIPPPNPPSQKDWPDHGVWVIAFQDYFKFEYSQNNDQSNSILAFVNMAGTHGGYSIYPHDSTSTNDIGQTFPMRYQKTNHLDTNITATALAKDAGLLLTQLSNTNARNFFYDGHGSPNSLANIASSFFAGYIHHPYRFVFLDGCSTYGGPWLSIFGIEGRGTRDLPFFQATGIRPGAFCGYTIDVPYNEGGMVTHNGVPYDDTIPFQVPGFITNFIFYWDTENRPLANTIALAKAGLPRVRGVYREDYLKIHGYTELLVDGYNHLGDWP